MKTVNKIVHILVISYVLNLLHTKVNRLDIINCISLYYIFLAVNENLFFSFLTRIFFIILFSPFLWTKKYVEHGWRPRKYMGQHHSLIPHLDLLHKRAQFGFNFFSISGGKPTLRDNLQSWKDIFIIRFPDEFESCPVTETKMWFYFVL